MLIPFLFALHLLAPADSAVYTVYNHDRPAGTMVVWQTSDSARVQYVYTDRNRGTRAEMRYHMVGGLPVGIEYRTVLPDGKVSEPTSRLELFGDSVRHWSPSKTTTAKAEPGVDYTVSFAIELTPFDELRIAKRLLRAPTHTVKIQGDSTLSGAVVREVTVRTTRGSEHLRLVAISVNTDYAPDFVWLDSHDDLFATSVNWFTTVRPGAEPALPTLRKIETELRDAAAESLNKRLLKKTNAVLAIVNGNLFDSDRGVMRPRTTVVVQNDRIVAVGPADSVTVPAGATVIDAAGKTIMPGMWDMHGHLQASSQSSSSPMQLSFGVTTVRDLGSDKDLAVANRDHAAAGTIPGPRQLLSGLIDGPGAWAGPTADLVRTEAEARALVAHFDSLGYKQIKLYNLVHPDLVPTFATEAHKRGMRLSGHIPRGLSVRDAIALGFDEVNHAAFLFSTFYPDSLYAPKMRAYSLVATTVAPHVDVDGAPMTELIADLVRHHTVIDGTWAVWVVGSGTGTAQGVGAGVSSDPEKADANYMRLLKRLYDAGVTLVPGTDEWGSTSFDSELELYEKVGIPAAVVLQIATIVPARVMKDDRDYGSVAVGKVADLFIVNGNPAEHVKDVRNVEQVVRGGRLYDAQDLRVATGLVKPQ
ncbi:MAG: amidohydrolase family protein [bacterium]